MTQLFTPEVGIVRGSNDSTFTQLEFIINPILENRPYKDLFFPALGLFGEASTGKTTCANMLVKALGVELFALRGDEVTKSIESLLQDWIGKRRIRYDNTDGGLRIYPESDSSGEPKKIVVFIDEAHKLSQKAQNELLQLIDTHNFTWYNSGISYILATTDRSDLVYPLQTRLFPIVFEPYSAEDIGEMLLMKYKNEFEKDAAIQIAIFSKLVPRSSFKLAEVISRNYSGKISKELILEAGERVFGFDEQGLDKTDKRILVYLKGFKQNIQPYEEIALDNYRNIISKLDSKPNLTPSEHKSLNVAKFNISLLEKKEAIPEYVPKSLDDISIGCKLFDTGDLRIRLNYLEQLKLVEKSSKGVRLI